MAYFAQLQDNIVMDVIVVSDDICGMPTLVFPDTDAAGRAYIANGLKFTGTWAQTSIDGLFRGCYAAVGYTFNSLLGEYGQFIPPTPEPEPTFADLTKRDEPPIVDP